jgi:hypothetical protein
MNSGGDSEISKDDWGSGPDRYAAIEDILFLIGGDAIG